MDPDAAWRRLLDAFAADQDDCREAGDALSHWLQNGGFPPRVTGIRALDTLMVQAVCTYVLQQLPDGDDQ